MIAHPPKLYVLIFNLKNNNSFKVNQYYYFIFYFLVYKKGSTATDNKIDCTYTNPPKDGQVCKIDITQWSPCVKEKNYNYDKHGPCIFLKLNKIYGWIPQVYNDTNKLPEKMPNHLKEYIKNTVANKKETVS